MKSFTKSLLLLVILLLILAPAAFAQEAAPAIPANSITGIAVADGRFDTLAAAAVAAGLADDLAGGEWTVFAPTDDAFAKLGLNPDNVSEAIRQVRPWAVDVSSGVEAAKGIKDAALMAAFMRGVRDADV